MKHARVRRPRTRAAERRVRQQHAAELLANALQEAGAALEPAVREPMEARFGHDLRAVRIHTGPRAEAAADAFGAHALTVGDDVLFAAGGYAPQTVDGRMLLAHELAHVLQGRLGERAAIVLDGPAAESPAASSREAEREADAPADSADLLRGDVAAGASPDPEPPGVESPGAEHGARDAAARALAGMPIGEAALAAHPAADVARFVRDLPLQASIALLADPFVEVVALDFARALERDADRPPADLRRRLARLPEATRGAVVDRVQELLPEAQRQRAAETLTAAVVEREDAPAEEAQPVAEAAEERATLAPGEPQVEPEPGAEPAQPGEKPRTGAAEPRAAGPAVDESQPAASETPAPAGAELAAGGEAPEAAGAAPEAAEGEARVPDEAEASPPTGEAGAEAAAAAPAAEAGAGAGAAEPDLGPLREVEERVQREGAQREEAAATAAREADVAAAPGAGAADAAGADAAEHAAEPEPDAAAGPGEATGAQAEAPAGAGELSADRGATAEPSGDAPAPAAAGGESPAPADAAGEAPEAAVDTAADVEPAEQPGDEPPPSAEEQALAAGAEPAPPADETAAAPAGAVAPDAAGDATAPPGLPAAIAPAPAAGVGAVPLDGEMDAGLAPAEPEALGAVDSGAAANGAAAAGVDEVPAEAAGGGEPGAEAAAGAASTGDCGPDVGGGGGGGAAVEAEPEPAPPDVSAAAPDEAMGAVAGLAPVEMGRALGGVSAAAGRDVDTGRTDLAAAPPSLERPAGPPETRPAGAAAAVAAAAARVRAAAAGVVRAATGGASASPTPEPLPPAPPVPTQSAAPPAVRGSETGQLTAADAQAMSASVDRLPVTDPGLDITAGPPPTVVLEGDASPERAAEQRAQLDASAQATREEGSADAAAPLGEDDVYPTVEPETLTATPPGGAGNAIAAPPAPEADEPTAIVAREQQSETVQAAATQAQSQMGGERTSHETRVAEGRTQASADMDEAVRASAQEQQARREEARGEVQTQRAEWSAEQETAAGDAATEADTEQTRGNEAVQREREDADRTAAGHVEQGNSEAATARRNAERDARSERDRGRQESRGVLGWLADQARGFFDRLRQGIRAIFDAARTLVRNAIRAATDLAFSVIDAARRRIVDAIRAVGDLLIAIGDRLLAAFPALRERFRAAIRAVVDRAVAAVNALADALKAAVQAALDALGALLEGFLNLLESAYMAAVEFVAAAVQRAISAAQAVVQALGQFAALVVDVAANPGRWLSNLAASVVDGIRNHLWNAIKCAVKNWFNAKVEELLGMARMIWNLLRRGGIRFAEIGRMLWEAIKASLPAMLIQLAIEKLVSLIVPAASALMLIIDGLRAAWGSISRIVAAFESFFRFLRAVRGGNAGPQFAQAVAAGAIALIEFLANFLLLRLRGPAQGVAGRLRALAGRVGASLRRVGQAVVRTVQRVTGAVRRGGRAAAGAVRTVVRQAGRAVVQVGRRVVAGVARVVQRVPGVSGALRQARRAWQRARQAWRAARARIRRWRAQRRRRAEERRRRRREQAERRLHAAVAAIRPQAAGYLGGGVARARYVLRLGLWQLRYRLRSLHRRGHRLIARVNPEEEVISDAEVALGTTLEQVLQRAEAAFFSRMQQQQLDQVGEAVGQARERSTGGPVRDLDFAQRVLFFRAITSLGGFFRGIANRIRSFGSDVVGFLIRSRRQMGGWRSLYPPRPAPRVAVTPARAALQRLAPGSYGDIASGVGRLAPILRTSPDAIVMAASAPTRVAQVAAAERLLAGAGPAGQKRILAALLRRVLQALGIVRAMEAARMRGQLASQALSVSAGGTLDEVLTRDPMAAAGSGEAAEREERGRTNPMINRDLVERASRVRRARIAQIFRRVAARARSGQLLTQSGSQQRALQRVAAAFEALVAGILRRHNEVGRLPEARLAAELAALEAELQAAVLRFLRTFHGGGS